MICRPVELPLTAWPEADQIAWADLFRKGDILEGQGAAVHWAEATRQTNRKHYEPDDPSTCEVPKSPTKVEILD